MNPLSVVILIGIFINISFEFKTDCTGNIVDVCTVYLTPSDDAYQTLLESIGYDDKMANDFNLNPYETEEQKIENVNNAIYGLSEETIVSIIIIDFKFIL
uniref:Uncharacterized protein n=1 Tax=Strongyloides papillosus TaxID=174720 RepID=A0A0N5B4J3_STREA